MEEKKEQNKLSYEELERIAMQLNAQVRELSLQLQNEREMNFWGRLETLMNCIANADKFKDTSFIAKCCTEVKDKIYPETQATKS